MTLIGHLEHLRYRRFLDASIDGELAGRRARCVRSHISTCPRCTRDEILTLVVKEHLGRLRLLDLVRAQPDDA